MNIRIAFRVQEQRDVDLILGQGMLKAGWHAHKLNSPGKFLVSSPEHDNPRRARAYLLTDDDVTDAAAHYATVRPRLDDISRLALVTMPPATETADDTETGQPPNQADDPEAALWDALAAAADEGISVPELVAAIGMSRRWIYYRLGKLAAAGRAVQTTRGLWRIAPQGGSHE
jgi:S-DNA-T family DNA segregation ATPase FtsK/SpoIIIE